MVSRGQLLRGAYAQLVYLLVGADEQKMERLKEGMLQLTKGWDRAQVERLVQDAILDVIDPFVYQEALDLIALHRSEGRRIYIVSSSPEEVVRPLARHFGVARRDRHPRAGRGRRPLHGRARVLRVRAQKAEAIRELAIASGSTSTGSYAYSDSLTDLPMLEVVGHPVAVNPDRELRAWPRSAAGRRGTSAARSGCGRGIASAVPPPRPSLVAAAFGVVAIAGVWCGSRSAPAIARRATDERSRALRAPAATGVRSHAGCREVPARGAEPTRESCRGRHAPGPGTMVPAPGACADKRLIPAPLAFATSRSASRRRRRPVPRKRNSAPCG